VLGSPKGDSGGCTSAGLALKSRLEFLYASVLLAVGIYSISVLAGALSFIPSGLGSTEAVMVLLLTLVGADTPTAVAATLICRLAILWFAVVIGGGVSAALELSSKADRTPIHTS
jgi:uncharacterized protein (TIRG00374 family)